MKSEATYPNCQQAREMDLVDYLFTLGFRPTRIRNWDYWYISPFRDEKTASFKISRKHNLWYDYGMGKGGSLIDFGILFHGCSIPEFLKRLHAPLTLTPQPIIRRAKEVSPIQIDRVRALASPMLMVYLKQRRVSFEVARKYCREVCFTLYEKTYTAIGFKNSGGGYELRNGWFKGGNSPKTPTRIENGSPSLAVFEGFFNFLSYKTIYREQGDHDMDFLVLNSASFFEKCRPFMDRYDSVHLYLDRDGTGFKCRDLALSWGDRYRDESPLYAGYNDLNEWVQQVGKSLRKIRKTIP